jgi:hypothetical protein
MRRLAFACLVGVMVVAALLLGSRHQDAALPSASSAPREGRSVAAAPTPSTPGLDRAARRFLDAFLAYESGGAQPGARAAIRRSAAPRLARELLGAPTEARRDRAAAPLPRPTLRVARLPHSPDLALITGTARRRSGPESFAFLFAHRSRRWLAIAPAE